MEEKIINVATVLEGNIEQIVEQLFENFIVPTVSKIEETSSVSAEMFAVSIAIESIDLIFQQVEKHRLKATALLLCGLINDLVCDIENGLQLKS